jgi:molecular chaperone Hsp33
VSDTVVRALTDDGAFRVITAVTTETVRGALAAQGAEGEVGRTLGELITGAIIVREAMAPRLRVQAILKRAQGGGSMVADSHPDGTARGLLSFGGKAGATSSAAGELLQMMRTLPSGAIHQGVVKVPEGGVSGALMAYMADSEQIATTIAVAAVFEGEALVAAGGYLVQLLPEVERGPLMIMTERLAELPNLADVLRAGATPDALLAELLYGMPFTRTEESPLSFGCNCSQLRVLSSLATLPRADIEDLIKDGEVLEINCDYCRTEYRIPPTQLRTLLTTS